MKKLNAPMGDHRNHPTDDVLEEYMFGRLAEAVLEPVETHVLTCDLCVRRLELLETDAAALKLALSGVSIRHSSDARAPVWNWISLPSLAWITAAALLALFVSVPKLAQHGTPKAQVTLHAYRGSEIAVLPMHQSALLTMDAFDLPTEAVSVQVVDSNGKELWTGRTSIRNDRADVVLPALTKRGTYFLRLYGPLPSATDTSLLREFVFQVH